MREILNLALRSIKWRFQNMVTIIMSLVQPLMWLLIFGNLFNSQQENYTDFITAGILVMGIVFGAGMSGIANYSLRQNGSFYRMMIAPIKRNSIVIAHFLDSLVASSIQTTVLILLSFILGVRVHTGIQGLLLLYLLATTTVLFVSTFFYALSFIVSDENIFIALLNTFTLPLFFLSTALLEKNQMPSLFQTIASFNPFSYVVDSFRNIILHPTINSKLYLSAVGITTVLGIISTVIATKQSKFVQRSKSR